MNWNSTVQQWHNVSDLKLQISEQAALHLGHSLPQLATDFLSVFCSETDGGARLPPVVIVASPHQVAEARTTNWPWWKMVAWMAVWAICGSHLVSGIFKRQSVFASSGSGSPDFVSYVLLLVIVFYFYFYFSFYKTLKPHAGTVPPSTPHGVNLW